MKKILVIAIAAVIVIFIIFKAVATEPPAFLPGASVGDGNPQNSTTLSEVLFGSTTIVRPKTASSTSQVAASKIESAKFNFTGYGPGKEHIGTFKDVRYNLTFSKDGKIESGTMIVLASSVDTGNATLNKDLCSETFFNCSTNPNIVFSLNKVVLNNPTTVVNASGTATGVLNFKGKTKTISFPFTFSRTTKPNSAANAGTYSADFRINMKDFYSTPLVNDEVRMQFTVISQ